MGSGSTIAAAEALGIQAVGVEKHVDYFEAAKKNIEQLSLVRVERDQRQFSFV